MQKRGKTEEATVLVVDDEQDIADLYSTWLLTAHDVRTAHSGTEALQLVDASVDVVFLDRQMPDMSGDEVLDTIAERGIDPAVVMVTAVDPDFDIVEMPFDHYVSKPVDGGELEAVIDRLLELDQYDGHVTDLYGVTEKIVTLEAEKTQSALADSDEYAALVDRRERLEAEMADIVASMDDEGVGRLFDVATGDER